MTRPLRQRHRRMVIALGIFLPIAFAVGLAARKPAPVVAQLPAALAAPSKAFEMVEWERSDLFTKSPIQVRLLREQKGAGRFAITLSPAKDLVKPDLIVYWITGSPSITDTLPNDARLLGGFGSVALPLPGEATNTSGVLVLYSLADHEIVDVSQPFQFITTK